MKKLIYLLALTLISIFAFSCNGENTETEELALDITIVPTVVDTVQPIIPAPDTTAKPLFRPGK